MRKHVSCLTLTVLIAALASGPVMAGRNSSAWNFDSGSLATASGVGSMYYLDDGFQSTESLTEFGTTASGSFALIPDLPNGSSGVMKFPGLTGERNGYRVDFNLPDKDGPTAGYLDSYTVVYDLYIDEAPIDSYVGLLNTNEAHENGAEIWIDFFSSTGGFWREGAGPWGNDSFQLDTWHRVAFVMRDSATCDMFVDGVKVADDVPWDDGDSLYTTSDPDPDFGGASFSILGDGDIYHGEGYISAFAFVDEPLGDNEIAALGGAKAEGILVPDRIPGDGNLDGAVTGADYTIWADNFNLWNGDANFSVGDYNEDGFVTGADYTIWADNFGTMAAPVPEPGALVLGGLALAACLAVGRRRTA
jgi:hypothetical protein